MAAKRPTLHLRYSEEATKDPATHSNAALLHKALRYRRKSHVGAATTNELYDRWGVKWHKVEKDEAKAS
ncbi:hypothetical protein SDRG_03673 [Saprolegnia diclina VS20]|uniref:Uncharacterized protein n=1 Tax=Saprolegnia diclina (strain VS20) TaxID=1156394 RepID=T0S162_SAPDV|nr:hypothetical protein SDRG_03673 [Saprolegnia diclina VS20]EQC38708.1 hypothetical protein SDRG_03673 [Saprolegnia diclina VS20]|eukprot:XP_008607532.1 hypothetical protein SDRG_03673 [Saprolegnia diclina VS20]